MKTKFKSKLTEIFITIVLILLLGNNAFLIAITGSMMALLAIFYLTVLIILLFVKSKYLALGLKMLGTFLIIYGIFKIAVQTLVSIEDLFTDPIHFIKLGIIVLGYGILKTGSQGILLEDK